MAFLDKILPVNNTKRKIVAVLFSVTISALLTTWVIYGEGQYGIALFVLLPLFMGASSTIIYGYKKNITFGDSVIMGLLTLATYSIFLVFSAVEGLICIMMAAPIGLLLTITGCAIGYAIVAKSPNSSSATIIVLILTIPFSSFMEADSQPEIQSVATSVEINANPTTVWKNLVEFSQLNEPEEFIFKAGIAYPINARIEGTGVGAVRNCNFTTGSFVEPITIWDEPKLLKFDVKEYPQPMKELSFWDVNAPHLHDYFVSKQGQFKLTELPNGKTLLEGTTWYYHNIRPAFYWKPWSDYIIHKIHVRVLEHIKNNSEL